jgi:hypothetical protein
MKNLREHVENTLTYPDVTRTEFSNDTGRGSAGEG